MSNPSGGAKRRILVAVAGALLVSAGLAVWWAVQRFPASFLGPVHTFGIDKPPPFLTDRLAVEKASEAMALDGLDPVDWQPREERRTTAPDGTPDVYLLRNSRNTNSGVVFFVDRTRKAAIPERGVQVELTADRVTCQVAQPK